MMHIHSVLLRNCFSW